MLANPTAGQSWKHRSAASRQHPAQATRQLLATRAVAVPGPSVHGGAAALRLNLSADTTLAVPIVKEQAAGLKDAINKFTETMAAKAKATRPQRWPMMEWRLQAGPENGEVEHMEVFCNPNASSSIFEAKALVTLRTKGGLKLTSEAKVAALNADVDAYLSEAK